MPFMQSYAESRHGEVPSRGESKSVASLASGSFVKDYLLFLLFTKSAAPEYDTPLRPPPCRGSGHTCMHGLCKEGRKNRKSSDEKGDEQAQKAKPLTEN